MPENGGTSFDVRDVMIVNRRLLRLLKKKQETTRYLHAKFFLKVDEHVFFSAIYRVRYRPTSSDKAYADPIFYSYKSRRTCKIFNNIYIN